MKIMNYSGVQLSKHHRVLVFLPIGLSLLLKVLLQLMCVSLKGPVKAEIIRRQDKGKRPHDDVTGTLMMQKLKTMLPVMMETAADHCQS